MSEPAPGPESRSPPVGLHAALVVAAKEFRENLRERRVVVSALLLGPLLGPLLFATVIHLGLDRNAAPVRRIELTVAHAERAPQLVAWLAARGIRVHGAAFDEAAARAEVQAHRGSLVLYVPVDFGSRLAGFEPAPLRLFLDESNSDAAQAGGRVAAVIGRYGTVIAQLRLAARGVDPLLTAPIAVQQVDLSTPASRSVLALGALSYFILIAMLTGGMYLAIDATAGERERGSLEPLLTVPVRREMLALGKLLAVFASMSLSLVITVAAYTALLPLAGLERVGMSAALNGRSGLMMVLACLPVAPLGAALMMGVATLTRSYREAQTWIGALLILPTLPLVFASILGLEPRAHLMWIPSLSQHFLITSLLRAQPLPASWIGLSVGGSLACGALAALVVCRTYGRERLLG